jgi:hypothetical protein
MRAYAPAIAILLMAVSAQGSQIFTDRTSFENSLASFAIEDVESAALVGNSGGGATAFQTFSDFSLSAQSTTYNADAVKILDTVIAGTGNTTPGGDQYVYLDSDIGFEGTLTTIIFSGAIQAIGFDYSGLSEPGASPTVAIVGQTPADDPLLLALNTHPPTNLKQVNDALFWGFISNVPFSTIMIDSDIDSAYGIDQVTYASVPEPGTAILLAVGLGLLASRASTRRAE